MFDGVIHDILMASVARWVEDEKVLRVIRRYPHADIRIERIHDRREE